MCLTTDNPEIKIAKKAIIVFKRVSICGMGPSGNFEYGRFGKEKIESLSAIENDLIPGLRFFERGYHSSNTRGDLFHLSGTGHQIFVIPKGAKYVDGWYNDTKNFPNRVSSTIIRIGSVYNPFNWLIALLYKL